MVPLELVGQEPLPWAVAVLGYLFLKHKLIVEKRLWGQRHVVARPGLVRFLLGTAQIKDARSDSGEVLSVVVKRHIAQVLIRIMNLCEQYRVIIASYEVEVVLIYPYARDMAWCTGRSIYQPLFNLVRPASPSKRV